jgi:hypothetical protein
MKHHGSRVVGICAAGVVDHRVSYVESRIDLRFGLARTGRSSHMHVAVVPGLGRHGQIVCACVKVCEVIFSEVVGLALPSAFHAPFSRIGALLEEQHLSIARRFVVLVEDAS